MPAPPKILEESRGEDCRTDTERLVWFGACPLHSQASLEVESQLGLERACLVALARNYSEAFRGEARKVWNRMVEDVRRIHTNLETLGFAEGE